MMSAEPPPTEQDYKYAQLESQLRSSSVAYPVIGTAVWFAYHDGGARLASAVMSVWCLVAFGLTRAAYGWLRRGKFILATRITVGLSMGLALLVLVFASSEVRVVGALGLIITQTFAVYMEDERPSFAWIAVSVATWLIACASWVTLNLADMDFGRATWPAMVVIPVGVIIAVGMMARGATQHLRRSLDFSEVMRGKLEERVAERTAALTTALAQLQGANESLSALNADLVRLNEELSRSNGELEQFAYVASHDLQEPLRKVQAFGDRLATRSGAAFDDTGRDYLKRMQNAAARMSLLINDLLSFSRVTSKAQPFQHVDLDAVLREVIADLDVAIQDAGGRVEGEGLGAVDADPSQMRQLLQNLVSNAMKFRHETTAPVVTVTRANGDGATAVIAVRDNGVGFDERYSDRIFRLFERLHGREKYPGTGVGLAICRKIVERHGGTIAAASTPGAGATFTITLPQRQPSTLRSDSGALKP